MASPDYPDAQFEWDEAKAIANLEKHGVSFREAREIFDDEFMQLMYDVRRRRAIHRHWHEQNLETSDCCSHDSQ